MNLIKKLGDFRRWMDTLEDLSAEAKQKRYEAHRKVWGEDNPVKDTRK